MVISQTPLRISFVGGGTDFREFYAQTPGSVLSTAIDKYIYVIVKERFDDKIYLNYSIKEIVDDVRDIKHDLIREAMLKTGVLSGVEITTLADIPSEGSGLGSSSSVLVGALHSLYSFSGRQVTAKKLASEACEIEIDILKKPIGKQDQYIAAYGGLREIIFNSDENVIVSHVSLKNGLHRYFGASILLYFTDITRKSATILSSQKLNIGKNFKSMVKMRDQVLQFKEILESGVELDQLGQILHEGWELKKELTTNISNDHIDTMYKKALEAGAIGGKISGAGGGGFLMLFVNRDKQNKVRKALRDYREFPFMLEPHGSKIIFNVQRGYLK